MSSPVTLLELNKSIQGTIRQNFAERVWVIGEISEIKTNRNGHCYFELVERDAIKESLIAKARGIIWSSVYRLLRPYFEEATGGPLRQGIKVLVLVSVEFHELYGFSIVVYDIDPAYTLGDMAQARERVIAQLTEEGILQMNKQTPLPLVPQNIAVISSETAAGYQDFKKHLNAYQAQVTIFTKLFPAIMQGNEAVYSIIEALEQIYQLEGLFDAIVIIRGGGSQSDLSCFDNYELASHIAQFPLPILTGIGHDKDESVADIVAHTQLKTPTAVAEFLIQKALLFENQLYSLENDITQEVERQLQQANIYLSLISNKFVHTTQKQVYQHKHKLQRATQAIHHFTQKELAAQNNYLQHYKQKLTEHARRFITQQKKQAIGIKEQMRQQATNYCNTKETLLSTKMELLASIDPKNVLRRGYSITKFNNKLLKNSTDIAAGDVIETTLYKGKIKSRIE